MMPFRAQYVAVNEGVRIRGCFLKQEAVREQEPWGSRGLEYCLSRPPVNVFCLFGAFVKYGVSRGSVRSTRGLGPTMTARGHSIGISIGMLPQTLIISRLDQLSRLGARI